MTLEQFITDFMEEVRNDAHIQNDLPKSVFLEKMSDQLQNMEYIFNPTIFEFFKPGTNNRIMKFDMFAFDETDKSLVLLINDFQDVDSPETLTNSDIIQMSSRMLNFLEEVYKGSIYKFIDPSQPEYLLARDLQDKLTKDFIDSNKDERIEKIKLFIITNKKLSKMVKTTKLDDFVGKRVELNVWDIERIYAVINSGRDKEPIEIDFENLNGDGLAYLKAEFNKSEDYEAYLSIIPGKVLSDIYWEHGSKLLEGNVRAFLSYKGKVNKGIRKTIKEEPSKFFTYNNGIACTAKEIEFSSDKRFIKKIIDLQIINGGQTTASLTSSWKVDKATLEDIYVPMKITVIKSNNYDDMIQNISRFANSQNKVTEADLFSNHPFHRTIEKLSREVLAPPMPGEFHGTYWYYERSRGKYQQLKFKLDSTSKVKQFEKKYPKNQVLSKEDLAKYLMAGIYLRPDWVSKGKAHNMTEFAKRIDTQWVKDRTIFNEKYFKDAVAFALLYKYVDYLVAHSEWYQKGGVKLNIVPYTISKLMYLIPKGYTIDFNRIWREQRIYDSFKFDVDKIAQSADRFINNSQGVIPTEKAKKEQSWEEFKKIPYELSKPFLNDLISIDLQQSEIDIAKKSVKLDEKISLEVEIYNLARTENGKYWERLAQEGLIRGIITSNEADILRNTISELGKDSPKRIPSESQYKIAWNVRKKLEDSGVLV
ncbi:AIPR family protein [Acholeplasma equirhinis]|uniref:AIPR family protein n=1 Tax=Acholeplasma equirhinis TaxID=555393 RepID=UPI00197AB9B6|nr:AIPR family protein [Acholeplasma equirhinis]MBN3489923.1 AIPR family protein [Acholeplasma equirhinis]